MKKLSFLVILTLLLGACTAVLKNSGYSSKGFVKVIQCDKFSYQLDSVAYWKRFDMMGPLIPIFPSWTDSKTFGISINTEEGVDLSESHCPVIRFNGVLQAFSSFSKHRNRCSYRLSEIEHGDFIELEVEHPSCETKKVILEKYEKWDYVPPFMVTV